MADEDQDSSSAFPSGAASWNPALRAQLDDPVFESVADSPTSTAQSDSHAAVVEQAEEISASSEKPHTVVAQEDTHRDFESDPPSVPEADEGADPHTPVSGDVPVQSENNTLVSVDGGTGASDEQPESAAVLDVTDSGLAVAIQKDEDTQETLLEDTQETLPQDTQETLLEDTQETLLVDTQETLPEDTQQVTAHAGPVVDQPLVSIEEPQNPFLDHTHERTDAPDTLEPLQGHSEEPSTSQSELQPEPEPESDHVQYEYQGDATEADVAVDEAPTASLLHEPEMAYDAIAEPSSEQVDTEPPENDYTRAGIHNDITPPVESKPSEWDSVEVDDEFASILGKTQQSQPEVLNPFGDAQDAAEAFGGSAASEDPFTAALNDGTNDLKEPQTAGHEIRDKQEDIEDLWAAALDDDDLLDPSEGVNPSGGVDPSGFFDDDDDGGFLQDSTPSVNPSDLQPSAQSGFSKTSSYAPASAQQLQGQRQPSFMPQSGLTYNSPQESFGPRPASTPTTFLPGLAGQFAPHAGAEPRPAPKASSSFVDKSKSGYSSPYDLPTEIVAPRRRAPAPLATPIQSTAPPLRSSSMTGAGITPSGPPRPPSSASTLASPIVPVVQQTQQSPRKTANDNSGFFADLPMLPKSKPRQSTYSPAPGNVPAPLAAPPHPQWAFTQPPAPHSATSPTTYGGLRQPDALPLYPEQATSPTAGFTQAQAPPTTNRYSPAPVGQQVPQTNRFSPMPTAPPTQARYAAAPGAPLTSAQRSQSFIPKTSSPLVYHDEVEQTKLRQIPSGSFDAVHDSRPSFGHRSRLSEQLDDVAALQNPPTRNMTPPQGPPRAASVQNSPRHASRYAPSEGGPARPASPPNRPRTQSPLHAKKGPSSYAPIAGRQTSVNYVSQPQQPQQPSQPRLALPSRQQFSSDLNFDVPQDERSADHLERWKGHPIFHWSPSGILVSSFPKQTPFYAAGHAIPVIKCTAGEIKIHDTKATFPLDDKDTSFPGPLQGKGKSKKKDVLSWLASKIDMMSGTLDTTMQDPSTPTILKQRAKEKLLLWKTVQLLIEHDNILEGKAGVAEAIRRLFVNGDIDQVSPLITQSDTGRQGTMPEQNNPTALTELRKFLFEGQREKAVWYATEQKLWSHAMLIASTMGPDLWKQLIHEFVKSQLKGPGDGIRSLAAVYEVFAGNHDESIDELVPPFARAGLTLGHGNGAAATGIDGLEKWRETLSLILCNRSTNDGQAIAALGKMLAGYGRIEAAHTCYLFARTFVNHSGADDPEAAFVLLGGDHKSNGPALGSDLDTIMLTEVYEYAQSLNPIPGSTAVIPHLQVYKLIHAYSLADHGMRSEAQSYCESIHTSIKSSTRASPYYHAAFIGAVEDLNRCLSQAPQTSGSTSLFSKLSSDKVSGSMWKRFNTFVAGDEDDNASTTSGPGDHGEAAGPFGKVTGNSPAISRATSNADLYGAMSMGAATNGTSAYPLPMPMSPVNAYGLQTSPVQPAPQQSLDRTVSAGRYAPQSASNAMAQRSVSSGPRPYEPQRTASGYFPAAPGQKAPFKSYAPHAPQPQESRQPNYGSYIPVTKPDGPVRSVSDYAAPQSAGPVVPPMIRPPSAGLHVPPSLGSPYKPQPSPLSADSSPLLHNGYIPPLTHSPVRNPIPEDDQEDDDESILEDRATTSNKPTNNSYNPPSYNYGTEEASYEPSASTYEPPVTTYEPPSASFDDGPIPESDEPASSSYEPPSTSYQPYEPSYDDAPAEDDTPRPKKKGIMDLSDDEEFPRPSPPPAASTAAADRAAADKAADEAFRKAAEADAERDKAGKDAAGKKGWFGGWFAGKKGEGGESMDQPKAVRAKLGEENSFYFDKELGKWVNKKGGKEEDTRATATPPPPMGAGRRVGTPGPPMGGVGPPSGPPSRVPSGVGIAGAGPPVRPPTSAPAGTPPLPGRPRMGTPGGEPPSRPSTGLSNASSIDDLLGPAGPKKGTVKGKKKGGRYVDVMAK